MGMKVRKGGTWRDITAVQIFANGAWRQLQAIKIFKSSAWRTIAFSTSSGGGGGGPMTLTVSPTSSTTERAAATIVSPPYTATPTGGNAPYTYGWSIVTQDDRFYAFGNAYVATTTITASSLIEGIEADVSFRCVVTDAVGATATSNTVSASFLRTDSL